MLALKEGLIKFQPYIEGESILAVMDHATLTWSKTFQNVNRRLLTWGTVFAAYPRLQIVHRAGRVHSNVDPISRLRRRIPYQQGPTVDATQHISLELSDDPLKDMYDELGDKFEEKLLNFASKFVNATAETPEYSCTVSDGLEIPLPEGGNLVQNYVCHYTAEADLSASPPLFSRPRARLMPSPPLRLSETCVSTRRHFMHRCNFMRHHL